MNKNEKLLMTKKELELMESGSAANVKFHSADRLKDYIKLTRKVRDKYRDLLQRQRVAHKHSADTRTGEKADIFDAVLNRYEQRFNEITD